MSKLESNGQKFKKKKHPLIRVKNVTKKFKIGGNEVNALFGVNLEIFSKEFIIIYGPSGCGKSTLLNVICGLEPPTSGKVYVAGFNVYNREENERAKFRSQKFGIVYQSPYWIRSLSVLENVALPLLIRGVKKKVAFDKAREKLFEVGLEKYENYLPTELSGGQQQNVGIARAIVTDPQIIIADEPTGNLDSRSGSEVVLLFMKLNKVKGRTIILVTHNMAYLIYASRRIAMKDGRIESIHHVEKLGKMLEVIRPGEVRKKILFN